MNIFGWRYLERPFFADRCVFGENRLPRCLLTVSRSVSSQPCPGNAVSPMPPPLQPPAASAMEGNGLLTHLVYARRMFLRESMTT